jgi:type IV secretory pathway VirB2 component (pilin)
LEAGNAMKTLLLIAYAALSLYAIFDVLKSSRDWATKVVLVAIILIPFVGAGLYLFAFRDKGYA